MDTAMLLQALEHIEVRIEEIEQMLIELAEISDAMYAAHQDADKEVDADFSI